MTRKVLGLSAVVLAALLTATSLASAQTRRPRFFVTITGTQSYNWTLEYSGTCAFKGHGEQRESFGTSRPVKVIPPPARPTGQHPEFQAFNGRGWGRIVPLRGRETRAYRVLRPPSPGCTDLPSEYANSCSGANPLLPRAGVVLMRVRQTVALHMPVATPWIDRRPSVCDLRLFDIRNYYLTAVFGVLEYRPVRGGTFENRRAKTLRWTVSVRACVGGFEFELRFRSCDRPPPSRSALTGELTASWTVTFRRAR